MLGRFSRQLRDLPQNLNRADREKIEGDTAQAPALSADDGLDAATETPPDGPFSTGARRQREELLSLVRVILERELGRPTAVGSSRAALEKLLEVVRSQDLSSLKGIYKYQLSQVQDPSDELNKARSMLEKLFA